MVHLKRQNTWNDQSQIKSPGKIQVSVAGEISLKRTGDTKSEATEMSLQGSTVVRNATKNYIRFIMSQRGELLSTVVHLEHVILSLTISGRNLKRNMSKS